MSSADPQHPGVVACLPAWNAEKFIEETLGSLAAQTYGNLHVLVSVDLSTDATAEICRRFAARDPRFEVIVQTERLGWVGNVNALLGKADRELCFFAFHDDLLHPNYVSALAAALVANPKAVLSFSDIETSYLDGRVEPGSFPALDDISDTVERTRRIVARVGDWWAPHRGLFRTEVGKRIGGLRRHLAGEFSADWPWLVRLSLCGEFVRVPQNLCRKRYMKDSLSLKWKRSRWESLAVNVSCIREVLRADAPLSVKWAVLAPQVATYVTRPFRL
jgi:glycosyltransferase involved in cell wall biosynthesis